VVCSAKKSVSHGNLSLDNFLGTRRDVRRRAQGLSLVLHYDEAVSTRSPLPSASPIAKAVSTTCFRWRFPVCEAGCCRGWMWSGPGNGLAPNSARMGQGERPHGEQQRGVEPNNVIERYSTGFRGQTLRSGNRLCRACPERSKGCFPDVFDDNDDTDTNRVCIASRACSTFRGITFISV
jgi:hypothetical protein